MISLALSLLMVTAAPDTAVNVYQSPTTWRTVDGAQQSLDRYRGEFVVLAFVYTSCTATCPLTTQRLKQLDAALQKAGKRTRVVIISLDPATDTPEAVDAYRTKHKLDGLPNFSVLVGTEAQLRTFTMLLDFRYNKNPESNVIMHDNRVYLLNPAGAVVAKASSLTEDIYQLAEQIPVPARPPKR